MRPHLHTCYHNRRLAIADRIATADGRLYPLHHGGLPLLFFSGSMIYIVLYALHVAVGWRFDPMDPLPQTTSVLHISKIWQLWVMGAVNLLFAAVGFGLEPLVEPVFSSEPYAMNTQQIGLTASVGALSGMVSVLLFGLWVYKYTGAWIALCVAVGGNVVGLLLLGPSPLLGGVHPSTSLAICALAFGGFIGALAAPVSPIFFMRILEREGGLTKDEYGSSMGALTMNFAFLGALTVPTITSALFPLFGFPWLCTFLALFVFLVHTPSSIILLRYNN